MTDTFLFFSSTMSNTHERIREIKCHINQLVSELRLIEPNNHSLDNFQPFNISFNASLTTISQEKYVLDHQCPYLSRQQAILHSTTYQKYQKIPSRKKLLTSSPKKSFLPYISLCNQYTEEFSKSQYVTETSSDINTTSS